VTMAQGYFFSHPLRAEKFKAFYDALAAGH